MSISHKKINNMIKSAIENLGSFGCNNDEFESLCRQIYLVESSMNETSSGSSIVTAMRDEIIRRSDDCKKDIL